MKSSPEATSTDLRSPLAERGGIAYAPMVRRDPITAFIELMEVVEALCPVWPPRELRIGTDYRL